MTELRAAADRLAAALSDVDEEEIVAGFKQMRRGRKAASRATRDTESGDAGIAIVEQAIVERSRLMQGDTCEKDRSGSCDRNQHPADE